MQGKVIIGTEVETKSFDKQIDYIRSRMEEIEDKLKKADLGYEVGDTQKLEKDYEKLNNQLGNLIKKQNELNRKDYSGLKNSIENVSKSVEKVTHKLTKMALAVFGIRSAFMFVRKSINTITDDNEQLKSDIDYMKNALAYTLEPVVLRIVELAKQLMFYVGYIIKRWTGKNIFENANKSLKSSVGSAKSLNKELSKTVAGFDEMNTLQSTSSSGETGGGAGAIAPSFDLSNLDNIEVPEWLEWIANNGNLLIAIIGGITGALIAMNLLGLTPLMALGIGAIITGIILLIQDVIKFIKDPSWDNFANILRDLAIILAGVAIAMLAVNAANPVAWIILAIAAIVALVALIIKNWDKIKEMLGQVGSWINDHIIKPIAEFFKNLWEGIKLGIGSAIEFIKNKFSAFVSFIKGIISTIIGLFKTIGTTAGNILASAFKAVVNGILKTIENILNTPIRTINGLIGVINKIPGINLSKLQTFNLPRLAKGGIVNNPGNGVFMGNYIAGEKGAEAVIPLNDETLDRLGLAFARHTTINATIPVYAYNRQVAREIRRIEANQNFAINR